jgi:hypothetical protein
LLLPAAYRSLSRPSSPLRAKAFTMRPYLLSLLIFFLTLVSCQYVKELFPVACSLLLSANAKKQQVLCNRNILLMKHYRADKD